MQYLLTPVVNSMAIIKTVEDMEKKESMYINGGNVNQSSHYTKHCRGSSKT